MTRNRQSTMMMRCLVVILAIAIDWPLGAAENSVPAHPNVLLITVDTLRADHLSSYGYAWKTSPNIDKVARQGARFERAYTVIPLTGPAHFSLFTSRYPQEHGARRNGEAIPGDRTLLMLPQVLRANGYRSGAFISGWPLNGRLTHLNDSFDDFNEDLTRTYQLFNSSRWAEDVTPPAIEWLKNHAREDRPFFLWVHYFDPHSPYNYREHFADLKPNGAASPSGIEDESMRERVLNYDTEIAYMDWHLGQLLAAVEELGIRDSTLVVLTADHGESLGEHDYVGHGRHLYEDILRVPLIVRLPGQVKPGQVISTPVSILDIAPTILDLTIRETLEQKKAPLTFTGRSLASAIVKGERLSERRVYYLTFAGKKGFMPKWLSWLWIKEAELPLRFGFLERARKLIWSPEDGEAAWYDLRGDAAELRPQLLRDGGAPYAAETGRLKNWFARTNTPDNETQLSSRDIEVLKSLGYVQ
jgi:arylsulfatase A-like enzyme